ncbi:MAG: MATE family efflux transporter [Eggerthellaceae bacterium]|nr:MATE family efflux transporter [Eggerthellaceae bacterium]
MNGPVAETLIAFALPLFFANLCQTAYNIVDMMIIGQVIGRTGLSGVSIGADVSHLLLFAAMGLGNASQVLISQRIGAHDMGRVRTYIGTLLTVMAIVSIVASLTLFLLTPLALDLMNTPPEAYESASVYLVICLAGMPFMFLYNALCAVFRAFGNSKTPLSCMLVASIVNLVLDLLFIVVFGWGVAGAATATILGQVVSFGMAFSHLTRNSDKYSFVAKRSNFKIDRACLTSIVKLGIPMALQNASITFSKVFVNSWINGYGVDVSAATGVILRVSSIAHLYTGAVMMGSGVMIARACGALNFERVKSIVKASTAITVSCSAVFVGIVVFAPATVYGFFTNETSVLSVCMEYVPVFVLEITLMAFRVPMNALINGTAHGSMNLLVALLDGIAARIGLSLLLGLTFGLGYLGFWLGNALAGGVPIILGLAYLASGTWKNSAE